LYLCIFFTSFDISTAFEVSDRLLYELQYRLKSPHRIYLRSHNQTEHESIPSPQAHFSLPHEEKEIFLFDLRALAPLLPGLDPPAYAATSGSGGSRPPSGEFSAGSGADDDDDDDNASPPPRVRLSTDAAAALASPTPPPADGPAEGSPRAQPVRRPPIVVDAAAMARAREGIWEVI
jgi:hypothetical protein